MNIETGANMLSLSISGFDADPDRITELLDLQPTSVSRLGELSKGARPFRKSGWTLMIDEPISSGESHQRLLNSLLEQVEGREAKFRALIDEIAPETITIYGGLHLGPDQHTGLWLDVNQMRILANCGIGWGLDIFDDGVLS